MHGKAERLAPGMLQLSSHPLACLALSSLASVFFFFNFLTVYPCCWAWVT